MSSNFHQWSFLVPLKGGRYHIIPQLAVYTTYILPIGWLYITYHLLRETAIDSMMPQQMQRQLRRAGPRKTVASLSLMEGCHWLLFVPWGKKYTHQWLNDFSKLGGDDWRTRIKTADVLKNDFLRWGNELKNGWIRNSCDLFRFFHHKSWKLSASQDGQHWSATHPCSKPEDVPHQCYADLVFPAMRVVPSWEVKGISPMPPTPENKALIRPSVIPKDGATKKLGMSGVVEKG